MPYEDDLMQPASHDPTTHEQISEEVLALIGSGRKIEAIKLIREETGLGLREAKRLVDHLASATGAEGELPPPFKEEGGLKGVVVIVVALVAAYIAWRIATAP